MKKYLGILLAAAAMFALLVGCGGHEHKDGNVWQANLDEHTSTCTECGQPVKQGAHELDESGICTVCGAQVIDWGDTKSVYLYNEAGDPLILADYEADGTLITETTYSYEYNADGYLVRAITMTDGILVDESTYTTVDGESVLYSTISYMDDGSKFLNVYDEHGNVTEFVSYDANGNVDMQSNSRYVLSADGLWYEFESVIIEKDGSKVNSEYAENGDQTSTTRYDADGNLVYRYTWVYTYDENGHWATMKFYNDDVLIEETVYATIISEDGTTTFPETVTSYDGEGNATVTVYDADGNVISRS